MEKNLILTLDGGGVRGLIQIRILGRIFDECPKLKEKILFIGGTSVGAINASGLGIGLTPAEIERKLYDRSPKVFEDSLLDDIKDLGRLLGSEYSVFNLKDVLEEDLKDKKVRALQIDCGFTVFDMKQWEPIFINSIEGKYDDWLLLDAVTGSASAITFFELWEFLTDGGLWAINPTLASLILLKSPKSRLAETYWSDIKVLNIGTGDTPKPPKEFEKNEDFGYIKLAQNIPDIFLDGVTKMIITQTQWLLHDDFHRVSPILKEPISLDDWKKRDELLEIGEKENLDKTFEWLKKMGYF